MCVGIKGGKDREARPSWELLTNNQRVVKRDAGRRGVRAWKAGTARRQERDFVCNDRSSSITIVLVLRTLEKEERLWGEGADQTGAIDGNIGDRRKKGVICVVWRHCEQFKDSEVA